MNLEAILVLYVAKLDNKYFSPNGWTDDLTQAKVSTKPRNIRAAITHYAMTHQKLSVPNLVKLHVTREEVVPEQARVKQVIANRKERGRKQKEAYEQWKKDKLTKDIAEATFQLEQLKLGLSNVGKN